MRPAEPLGLPGRRVLVVDDCELNLQMACRVLRAEGAQVQTASSGEQALALLAAPGAAVDLVLLDLQMPSLDGFETARRLRQLPGGERPVVLALSADDGADLGPRLRAAGLDASLAKPLDPGRLRAVLAGLATALPASLLPREAVSARQPAIALSEALVVWQELSTYRHYLMRFLREQGPELSAHVGCLAGPEAAPWLHRLRGVAGGLSLPALARAALQLEKTLNHDPERRAAGWQLMNEAWAEVQRAAAGLGPPAPEAMPAACAAPGPEAPPGPCSREQLLQALDRDNPDAVLPLLPGLAAYLPGAVLARLQRCIEDFDFRAAERLVREQPWPEPMTGASV